MTGSPDQIVGDAIAGWLTAQRPLVVGVCASQGAGKSTLCAHLEERFSAQGLKVAILSLDDLYLSHAARLEMARRIHPLFATRGVPGTHDVALGLKVLDDLRAGKSVRLPRFDKGDDNPLPSEQWPEISKPDLILFEGWCVGVPPQEDAALAEPVNALERDEDADGRWRRAVNAALAGPYAPLWARIDRLVFLAAPGFDVVLRWRSEAEQALRRSGGGARLMDDAGLARFIQHYERLTRYALAILPELASLTVRLDAQRRIV